MAIDVARREGVNRTAQQLHLDAGKLKLLLLVADARQHMGLKGHRQPGYVGLIAPMPAADLRSVIEFESADGSKMRIHWKTAAPLDWTSLPRALRDAE